MRTHPMGLEPLRAQRRPVPADSPRQARGLQIGRNGQAAQSGSPRRRAAWRSRQACSSRLGGARR